MRASAAIAAMRGEGADARSRRRRPNASRSCRARADDIDQRSRRDAAAPPFGEVGAGGAEFAPGCDGGHGCGCHAAALPFSAAIEAVGPDRQSRSAGCRSRCGWRWRSPATSARLRPRRCRRCRRARGRSRLRRKCTSISGRVGDAGNAIILHAAAEDVAGARNRLRALHRARSRCPG